MEDLKLDQPATEEVTVDSETVAAIDKGLEDARDGRSTPADEVREMIPRWISKFVSQKPR